MEHQSDVPRLQPSCSPDSSDSPTRWQKLRTLVQTKSLMPADPSTAAVSAFAGRHAAQMHNSALNHFATVTKPCQRAAQLLHGGATDRARTALLFDPDIESSPIDSLETELQVEAVLRKAAARAACMAGLPQAPPCHSKVLAGLVHPSAARTGLTLGHQQVLLNLLRLHILSMPWHAPLCYHECSKQPTSNSATIAACKGMLVPITAYEGNESPPYAIQLDLTA